MQDMENLFRNIVLPVVKDKIQKKPTTDYKTYLLHLIL